MVQLGPNFPENNQPETIRLSIRDDTAAIFYGKRPPLKKRPNVKKPKLSILLSQTYFTGPYPKLEKTEANEMDSSVQEPQINNTSTTFLDVLHVAVYIKRGNLRKVIFKDEMKVSKTRNAETQVGDKFHWSRPNTDEKTTNKLEFKSDISQLAGFLKKQPSSSKTIVPPNETSAQTSSAIQSSTRTDHTTDRGPDITPLCMDHEKKPSILIEQNECDFDYSLDLMDDSILMIRDATKKPTPLLLKAGNNNRSVQLSTTDTTQTDQSGQANMSPNNDLLDKQFVSDIDLIDLLDTLSVLEEEEFGRIINSGRGYICISYSKYRGIKRKIAFDYCDVEYVSLGKRSGMQ